MMKAIFALVILSASIRTFAQEVVILTDGSTLLEKEHKKLQDEAQKRILGSFKLQEEEIEYLKEVNDDKSYFVSATLDVEGAMPLYRRAVQIGSTKYPQTAYWYYIEVDGRLNLIYQESELLQGKTKRKKILSEAVADYPVLAQQIASDSFKLNPTNLRPVVAEYNLHRFAKPAPSDSLSTLFVFLKEKVGGAKPVVLEVNDSLQFSLVEGNGYSIDLPSQKTCKVCVTMGDRRTCRLVSAVPWFTKNYKVEVSSSTKKLTIEHVPSAEVNEQGGFKQIEKYTVARTDPAPLVGAMRPVYIYVNAFKFKGSFKISVNDETQYTLPWNRLVPLNVPSGKASKLCAQSDAETACLLINAASYYPNFFEVKWNQNDRTLKLTESDEKNARYYLGKAK